MNAGLDNIFISRFRRKINFDKPVKVYRNLHGGEDKKYSIMQDRLVVGYTNQIMLHDCKCLVNTKGQEKVRSSGRKNVHAYIKGFVAKTGGMGTTAADKRGLPAIISYNPYENKKFVCKNLTNKPFDVNGAMTIIISKNGVSAAYTN